MKKITTITKKEFNALKTQFEKDRVMTEHSFLYSSGCAGVPCYDDIALIMDTFSQKDMNFNSTVRYLLNLGEDLVTGPISVAETNIPKTPKAQRRGRKVSNKKNSEYLQDLLDGKFNGALVFVLWEGELYIVDGGHRTRFLIKIVNGEIRVQWNGSDTFFWNLPKNMQDKILNTKISVHVYANMEPSEAFIKFNSGNHVNNMEMLNADVHKQEKDNTVWSLAAELAQDKRFCDVLGSYNDASYSLTNTALQCLALPKYRGDVKAVSKKKAVDGMFEQKKQNIDADYKEKIAILLDVLRENGFFESAERAIRKTSKPSKNCRNHVRQVAGNASYAFYDVMNNMKRTKTPAAFERTCRKQLTPANLDKICDELALKKYGSFFGNGKCPEQLTVMRSVVESVYAC